MPVSIRELIGDEDLVALTYRQVLEPVQGRGAVVAPPTYPGPQAKRGGAERRSEYVINDLGDGKRICDLDTVQSQANRMEASYQGSLAELIPRARGRGGGASGGSHRARAPLGGRVDPGATSLAGAIRAAFESFAADDPAQLAQLAPTSLVYGVWDSRDTWVKVRRAIASRIEAHDVVEFTRSGAVHGVISPEELGLTAAEWKKGAKAGFAPSPATGRLGGIRVRGEIVQSASVMLDVLRRYRTADGSRGAGVRICWGSRSGGSSSVRRRYHLRSRCALVPVGPGHLGRRCSANGRAASGRGRCQSGARGGFALLRSSGPKAANIELGGEPEIHHYDPVAAARRMLKKKPPSVDGVGGGDDGEAVASRSIGWRGAITAWSGPPSPWRVYQALVAGSAMERRRAPELEAALRHLETLSPPVVTAPRAAVLRAMRVVGAGQ